MRDQTGELPDWLTPGGKRYFSADAAYRRQFGRKAVKLPLDAGFTCPNRDGRKGAGGCAYCSGAGSGDFAESALLPLDVQYRRQRERLAGKWPGAAPVAYFQAFTNTYGPVERIQAMLEEPAACRSRWSLGFRPRTTKPPGGSTDATALPSSKRAIGCSRGAGFRSASI